MEVLYGFLATRTRWLGQGEVCAGWQPAKVSDWIPKATACVSPASGVPKSQGVVVAGSETYTLCRL